jgi:hypothetical protein
MLTRDEARRMAVNFPRLPDEIGKPSQIARQFGLSQADVRKASAR